MAQLDRYPLTSPIGMEFVCVPAGEFLMGSDLTRDREAAKCEQRQHQVFVEEFYIGAYPVTNTQYAAFVKSTGCPAPSLWNDGSLPPGTEEYPVVQSSWHDARAFCAWLAQAAGRNVRLPTEAEWEKAARGTDGRLYPWGDRRPTHAFCNHGMLVGSPTPVNYYPQNVSPYGVRDMAGNVGEWTSSLYKPYPYQTADGREDPAADGLRIVRGGAFGFTAWNARCACRLRYAPDRRSDHCGFRVVVSLL